MSEKAEKPVEVVDQPVPNNELDAQRMILEELRQLTSAMNEVHETTLMMQEDIEDVRQSSRILQFAVIFWVILTVLLLILWLLPVFIPLVQNLF